MCLVLTIISGSLGVRHRLCGSIVSTLLNMLRPVVRYEQ